MTVVVAQRMTHPTPETVQTRAGMGRLLLRMVGGIHVRSDDKEA